MRKPLVLLVAAALIAAPSLAQSSPSNEVVCWDSVLEELKEVPVLGRLIALATQDDEVEEATQATPESDTDEPVLVEAPTETTEARGGWTPWG